VSDVQRGGLQEPREGDKLEFEVQRGQQGKLSAGNLKQA
jgi:cold shock protein